MTQGLEYKETELFKKEFKQLLKKFKTLIEDFNVAKQYAIELFHIKNINNQSIENLTGFFHEHIQFYKLRKFACKSLKGRGAQSGIRIIYAHNTLSKSITFLEIYFKGDKENEDRSRIYKFLQ